MSDERLRQMERDMAAAGGGTPAERAAYLVEQMRSGVVSTEDVKSMARRANQRDDAAVAETGRIALLALGLTFPQLMALDALGGRKRPENAAQARGVVDAYFRAMGYAPDRFGALVGTTRTKRGDTGVRLVFKSRVIEEYHGAPGSWQKVGSLSPLEFVDELLARTQGPAGEEALEKKREKKKAKAVERRTKEESKRTVLRAAAVLVSLDMTPDERRLALASDRDFEHLAKALTEEVGAHLADGATPEQIDAMLSVSSPPVFFPNRRRGDLDWPTSYKWKDTASGFDVEVSRKPGNQSVSIIIGDIPVDPITGAFAPRSFVGDEGYTGLAGTIRFDLMTSDEPQAQLYLIQSQRKRQGAARRMIRVFCRLVAAYGFDYFAAMAVGDEGAAMLLGLHEEREIELIGRSDSNVFVMCAGALDDPRQQRLFGPQPKLNR